MTWVALNADTCLKVVSKVGSQSMWSVLSNKTLSDEEAAKFKNRVMFVRHPITRLNSAFHHFYWMEFHNGHYYQFVPKGIIKAYGPRLKGITGDNAHHFIGDKLFEYQARYNSELGRIEKTVTEKELELNNEDYQRFIDYVLSGGIDDHWRPQLDQATDKEGNLLCNIAHRFEDIRSYWNLYVGSELPQINSWTVVEKSEYKLDELNNYYAKDIAFWEAINGAWNSNS